MAALRVCDVFKHKVWEMSSVKDLTAYNTKFCGKINKLMRLFFNQKNRHRLNNHDFSLLCNNCNGGIITHDLGEEFRSPTINMFFTKDHFFRFCEDFDYYITQPLVLCETPITKPTFDYPVCNLDDLELHFMHYHSFEEAKDRWEIRSARLNYDNLFVMWTFFDKTDPRLLERFERLPIKNKVAFTEEEFPNFPSAFCIKGYKDGLGNLALFDNFIGRRKIDQFDYVTWFNSGIIKRME